jgi:transcription elongation factor Elf1
MIQRLDNKLECPKCHTIYLTLTKSVTMSTPIHCSSCGEYLGTWGELESDFYAQGGDHGVFEMHDGQIIRKE